VLGVKRTGIRKRGRMKAIAKIKGIARSDCFCVTVERNYC
jgi:hypothetical protein